MTDTKILTPVQIFRSNKRIGELFKCVSNVDLRAVPAAEPTILSPFWGPGDIVNFSGESGCGKTKLAVDIAVGLVASERKGKAVGGLFRFNTEALSDKLIGVIDAENDKTRWTHYLREKAEYEGLNFQDIESRFRYIPAHELGLSNKSTMKKHSIDLALLLHASRIGFFIGDSLGMIWSPEDISSSGWAQNGLAPFRATCRKYGISGMMLTHTKRPGATGTPAPRLPMGTSFQESQADGQIHIQHIKDGKSGGIEFTVLKCRHAPWIQRGSKVKVLFTDGYGYLPKDGWETIWPDSPPEYKSDSAEQSTDTAAKIKALLMDADPKTLTATEIATRLKISDRTARNYLSDLMQLKRAEKIGNGPSTAWRFVST